MVSPSRRQYAILAGSVSPLDPGNAKPRRFRAPAVGDAAARAKPEHSHTFLSDFVDCPENDLTGGA